MTRIVILGLIICVLSASAGINSNDYNLYGPRTLTNTALASYGSTKSGPLQSAFLTQQVYTAKLDDAIQKGKALSVFGIVTHFSGAVIHAVSLPLFLYETQFKDGPNKDFPGGKLALSLIGMALNFSGTAPSVAGANLIEESFEDANISFQRNKYGNYYARSWAYEAAG